MNNAFKICNARSTAEPQPILEIAVAREQRNDTSCPTEAVPNPLPAGFSTSACAERQQTWHVLGSPAWTLLGRSNTNSAKRGTYGSACTWCESAWYLEVRAALHHSWQPPLPCSGLQPTISQGADELWVHHTLQRHGQALTSAVSADVGACSTTHTLVSTVSQVQCCCTALCHTVARAARKLPQSCRHLAPGQSARRVLQRARSSLSAAALRSACSGSSRTHREPPP